MTTRTTAAAAAAKTLASAFTLRGVLVYGVNQTTTTRNPAAPPTTAAALAPGPESDAAAAEAALVAAQLASILVVNLIVFAVAVVAFTLLRPRLARAYAPRTLRAYRDAIPERNDAHAVEAPPPGLFAWIAHTWRYSHNDMLVTHGLDAVVNVDYLYSAFLQFLGAAVYGLVVLTPVHLASPTATAEAAFTGQPGLLQLTLSNILNGSPLLWFHVIGIYFYSFMAYYSLFNFYQRYAERRIRVMMRPTATNYSVLVRQLPKHAPDGAAFDDHHLLALFEYMYPGEVASARVIRYMPKTAKLRAERAAAARQLERAAALIGVDPSLHEFDGEGVPAAFVEKMNKKVEEGERPLVKKGAKLGCLGGEKVDAVEHWRSEVERLGREIADAIDEEGLVGMTRSGFVTFTTIQRAYQVQQTVLERRSFRINVEPARAPEDVIYNQLRIDDTQKAVRTAAVTGIVGWMTFFWAIPIAAITSIVRLEKIVELLEDAGLVEFAKSVNNIPGALKGLISSVLPIAIVAVFLAVVPMLIALLMLSVQGERSHSDIELTTMTRYYAFIVVNVFIMATLSGVAVDVLAFAQELLADPGLLPNILGTAVPTQAFFFTFYVAQAALGALSMQILRVGVPIVGLLKERVLAKTAREYREAFQPVPFPFAPSMARHLLFFVINMTFSIATPLILPFAVLYYGAAYLFNKYNLLYVHVPLAHGNGKSFEALFARSYVGIAIFQVACIGIMGSKVAGASQDKILAVVPLIIVLLPITYLMYSFTRETFEKPARYLNRMESTAMMKKDDDSERGIHGDQFVGAYINKAYDDDRVTKSILAGLVNSEAEVNDDKRLINGRYSGKAEPTSSRELPLVGRKSVMYGTPIIKGQLMIDDNVDEDADVDTKVVDVGGSSEHRLSARAASPRRISELDAELSEFSTSDKEATRLATRRRTSSVKKKKKKTEARRDTRDLVATALSEVEGEAPPMPPPEPESESGEPPQRPNTTPPVDDEDDQS